MVLTNKQKDWKEIPQVNKILMCLLEKPLTYTQFPKPNSNWTRELGRNDNFLIRLEKEGNYIKSNRYKKYETKTKDDRKVEYTLKESKYLKEIIKSILQEINKPLSLLEKDTGEEKGSEGREGRMRNIMNDKKVQEFIKKFILNHKEIIIKYRKDDDFPSFNQMIKLIIDSFSYTDKKLYEKYLGFKNNNNLSLLIKLCNLWFKESEIETSTYVLLTLYGNKKDMLDYNRRRKFEGSSHY